VFGIVASLISFAIVKIHIRFAYFFFNFTSVSQDDEWEEESDDSKVTNDVGAAVVQRVKKTNRRMNQILKALLFAIFVSPVFVIIAFVNPLAKDFLVPSIMSEGSF